MNKSIMPSLLVLAFGFSLSTTALAEPYNHGGSYVNAISNAYPSDSVRGMQSVQRTGAIMVSSGFNDRGAVESENVLGYSRTVIETPISKMLSIVGNGFNDRG